MKPLRALDERVVPRLGSAFARVLGAITGSEYGGHPRRRLLIGAAGLSVALAAAATVLTSAQEHPAQSPAQQPALVRVGAAEGAEVAGYLAASRAELRSLAARSTAEVHALAALDSYVEPSTLPALLRGINAEVVFARVPLPDQQTEIVPLPVTAPINVVPGFAAAAARKEAAAKEATWAANKLTGRGDRERNLRAYYREIARVSKAEAQAYRSNCACVYGVVVRGTPIRLAQLAARPGVRGIDPAPEVRTLAGAVFLPLQPEQIAVVTPPAAGQPAPPPG